MHKHSAPRTEAELMARAKTVAGKTLQQIANATNATMPTDNRHAKGWVGQLLEAYLGATAGTQAAPDFEYLSIELKTLPINAKRQPKESTFICQLQLGQQGQHWQDSLVRNKLKRVLWVPVAGVPSIPFAVRHIGSPILWSPNVQEEAALRTDWEELMEQASLGCLDTIDSHFGHCLQIRPKAAHARVLTATTNHAGEPIQTLPRGFYLRPAFTSKILEQWHNS